MEVIFPTGERLPVGSGTMQEGQPVLFGIRPEHFRLGRDGGLGVEVVVVEPTGADTQVYCRFQDQEVTATLRDRTEVRPGDRITLVPDTGRAHLFDTESGRRLSA
jgi:multiple sugar transport system ATP-binding protein